MRTLVGDWRSKLDVALWVVAAAAVGVALSVALARFSPAFDILAQTPAPLFSVVLAAAVAALVLRRWRPMLGLILGLSVLLLALQTQWFASTPPPAAGARPVRIYFDNIWRRNGHADLIRRSVAEARPDILAIAEFSDLQAKDPSLLAPFPYRAAEAPDCRFENCPRELIASRWPLDPLAGYQLGSYGVVAARVHAPEGAFRLVVVHLTRPWPFKHAWAIRYQERQLAKALKGNGAEPVVVVGDFNATLSGAVLKEFGETTGLAPVRQRLGDWPSMIPAPLRVAIENAFAGQGETIVSRRLGRLNGSDHAPIVLEVAPQRR